MNKIDYMNYNGIIEINRFLSTCPSQETEISIALTQICQKQQEIISKINEIVDFINNTVEKKELRKKPIIQDSIEVENSTSNPNWANQ